MQTIEKLPKGAGVIFRDYEIENRLQYGKKIAAAARKKKLIFLIAGDIALAKILKADGIHFPEYRLKDAVHFKRNNPQLIVTAAVHDIKGLLKLKNNDLDGVFISPLFLTESHLEKTPLGLNNFRKILKVSKIPAYALGGISAKNLQALKTLKIVGISFIRGFS